MNHVEINIPSKKKLNSMQAFLTFCNKLQHTIQQEPDHALALVRLTCYRKNRITRYDGTVLLINGGHGIGSIRIADGEIELMDEHVYNVLERSDRSYSLGRTGSELIIDCPSESQEEIYRIDIEENHYQIAGGSRLSNSLATELLVQI